MSDNLNTRSVWTADNLTVMRGINSDCVDLIYADPPFNSNRNYAAPIGSAAEGATFKDTWTIDDIKRDWVEDIQADNTATWSAITTAGHTSGESAQAYLTYIAIRLLEMRRILSRNGSIYLHCDPTMSHYLKILMDAIFGHTNFRNEIIWSYRTGGASKKHFSRKHDTILFYSVGNYTFNKQQERSYSTSTPPGFKNIEKYRDSDGRWYTLAGMRDVWDINAIGRTSSERLGYPTQKPLALLERIISASSNSGDMVFDPFCGCATALVAAEKQGIRWAGCDIEPNAYQIVVQRLQQQADDGALFKTDSALPDVHHGTNPPTRTDKDAPRRSKNIKEKLWKAQKGVCAGTCGPNHKGRYFDMDVFEIDHIVPRSKGGQDIDGNLQLLCPPCNKTKGNKTMKRFTEITTAPTLY